MLPVSLVQVLENSRSAYRSQNSNFFTKCLKYCPESKSDGCLIVPENKKNLEVLFVYKTVLWAIAKFNSKHEYIIPFSNSVYKIGKTPKKLQSLFLFIIHT